MQNSSLTRESSVWCQRQAAQAQLLQSRKLVVPVQLTCCEKRVCSIHVTRKCCCVRQVVVVIDMDGGRERQRRDAGCRPKQSDSLPTTPLFPLCTYYTMNNHSNECMLIAGESISNTRLVYEFERPDIIQQCQLQKQVVTKIALLPSGVE